MAKGRLWVVLLAMLGLALAGFPADAKAAPGDIGYEGPSFSGGGSAITASKPESKVWWNDGSWWASMWDTASADFHIFKLNQATQIWGDTGVALDDRGATHADVLWDGVAGKLYVASHVFTESAGTGGVSRLYRYSYDPATDTYTRDTGFPVTINSLKLETLVIAKDSTGKLWATWQQGTKIWVNRTLCTPACNDASWGTPFVISSTAVKGDDISSVIAFGGNKIGVMWSDQNASKDVFGIHADDQADNVWSFENALQGPGFADDHINLKTDAAGRVFAAVKTSKSASADPLTMLLVRGPAGGWSSAVFGRVQDHHTRPIVEIDEANGIVHMFATAPESSGTIYEKTAPINSISFPTGLGTPIIKDADAKVNNATSTKQNVGPSTGLVVLASGSATHYWHNFFPLGGGGGPVPPTASFTAVPTSGPAPLTVNFTDTSSGGPTSWAWDFDNDGTVDSTAQNPSFNYTTPNTYTAKLTATNSAGSSSATKTITVTPAGPVPPTASFTAVPTSGQAPLTVNFTDTSSGGPTSWAWDFQNDGTVDSTAQNPSFNYTTPNTYTAKLTATNSAGSSSATKTITVTPAGGGGSTLTFVPTDDAYVRSSYPDQTAGAQTTIFTYKSSTGSTYSYVKFSLAGVTAPVTSAKLRLFVTDPSAVAGSLYLTTNDWAEGAITWNTKPEPGPLLFKAGSAVTGTWVEFDLGSSITGNGTYSFALKDGSGDAARYSSKEGANPPQLVVTFGS